MKERKGSQASEVVHMSKRRQKCEKLSFGEELPSMLERKDELSLAPFHTEDEETGFILLMTVVGRTEVH